MPKALRDVLLLFWGLGGITYLVVTGQVDGKLALAVFTGAAGITVSVPLLGLREAKKEVEKVAGG